MHITGNDVQYPVINRTERESAKEDVYMYVYMCITQPLTHQKLTQLCESAVPNKKQTLTPLTVCAARGSSISDGRERAVLTALQASEYFFKAQEDGVEVGCGLM